MKTKILSLIAAQTFATIVMLRSNSGIYTLLCVYAAQAVITYGFLAFADLSRQKKVLKIMTIGQVAIFSIFFLGIIFLLSQMGTTPVVEPDGTKRFLDIGKLSVTSLALSSVGYFIGQIYDSRRDRAEKLRSNFISNIQFFFISLAYGAEMILVIFAALYFTNNSLTIVIIAIVKTILDIGILVLTKAFKGIDLRLKKLGFRV